jgi:hypothetical protein
MTSAAKIAELTLHLPSGPAKFTGEQVSVGVHPAMGLGVGVKRPDGEIEHYYGVPFSIVLTELAIIPATMTVVPRT